MENLTQDKSLAAHVYVLQCLDMGRFASLWHLAHKFEIIGTFVQVAKQQITFIHRMLWKSPEQ